MHDDSRIERIMLNASKSRIRSDEPLRLDVSFSVDGRIRSVFNRETWLYAYDNHDNVFRVKYTITLKASERGRSIEPITFLRKASLYWSRDPTIEPYPPEKKVWVMIVIDGDSILPRSVEEAQSLLFDVNRVIDTFSLGRVLGRGIHDVYAEVKASWGKHTYTDAKELRARSDSVSIELL